MAIINRLKTALEFTRFADPNIREAMVDAINELAADMDELEFEEAISTRKAFARLDAALSEFENKEVVVEGTATEDIDEAPVEIQIVESETEVDAVVTQESDDDIEL